MGTQGEGEADKGLDFFSPHFEPLRALYTPGLQPPNPRARTLDWLGKCRVLLSPEVAIFILFT